MLHRSNLEAIAGARCVIFDLDGTLVRLNVDWDALRNEVSQAFPEVDCTSLREAAAQIEAKHGRSGIECLQKMICDHENRRESTPIYWTQGLLRACAQEGKSIGVFTANMRHTACRALARYELDTLVDAMIAADDVRNRKPDPEGLIRILQTLDVSPQDAVYIADGPWELDTGNAAGVTTVRVDSWP
jgi:phosphoglycolate phosphatase